jgi:hypothetical protein
MANFDFILPIDSKLYKKSSKKINEYPNVIHIPDFDLEKAIELDREKEKRKPKLRMLPPINILS